jgi:hypothetical protein
MGLKDIVGKDSWTEAKKVINTHLRCDPYWPGPTKELFMTTENVPASAWWEEVLVYHCKPSRSDLFNEESHFDGKGFKMFAHIEVHFNPSGAVDFLGYIFDLIDVRQAANMLIVTLKMGDISIKSMLQFGFMLCNLLLDYQAVVQEFRLSRHSFTMASLQAVVEQCVSYDKGPGRSRLVVTVNQFGHPWQT